MQIRLISALAAFPSRGGIGGKSKKGDDGQISVLWGLETFGYAMRVVRCALA